MDRADIVHENFIRRVKTADFPANTGNIGLPESGLSGAELNRIFRSQLVSQHLDRISRKMQAAGQGFYTIGSSGHEGNAAVAAALRVGDPAFLHYRDAAFQIHRSSQLPGQTPDP